MLRGGGIYWFFRDFRGSGEWTIDWLQVQFSAEEQDPGAIVAEVAETSGVGLEVLDHAVEAFTQGVGDAIALALPRSEHSVSR